MSREQYQIPTTSQGAAPGAGAKSYEQGEGPLMHYICGDCGLKFPLRRADAIRCTECGCRILYKERTKRMVQFEAR